MQYGFFLGANSKRGFHSFYDNLIDLKEANTVYIIKGSPGCGKSSFMKKIKMCLTHCGYEVEDIWCSSDPESLDGIVIPKLKVAFVDGTAPHIVEPKYPLAVEKYINLGDFIDADKLRDRKREIITLTDKYREGYPRVYTLLKAAGAIEAELLNIALGGISIEKLRKKANGIISRELNSKGSGGAVKRRFLSSISSNGYATLFDTANALAEEIYVLDDNFGLGAFLLNPIAEAAISAGFDVYLAYSPLCPERLEHIIIPERRLAFVTSKKYSEYKGEYKRRVRIDAMIDTEYLREKKKKVSFSRKLMQSTLSEAYALLKELKLLHDDVEALYNPYVNFDAIYEKSVEIANKLVIK